MNQNEKEIISNLCFSGLVPLKVSQGVFSSPLAVITTYLGIIFCMPYTVCDTELNSL